jgi:DNA-binding HxlR family transcriptional regulator
MADRNRDRERCGAYTLIQLALPLNCLILRALGEGTSRLVDLRRAAGVPAQTTLRVHLKRLEQLGAIAAQRGDRFPGALEYELTDAGQELLEVAAPLEHWLEKAPEGPLAPGSSAAKAAIKALVEGWSTCMLRALAVKPFTLTQLDEVIGTINYPSLERRVAAMRLTGQLEAQEGDGRGKAYGVSAWACQAVAPIIAATRWERRHLAASTPPIEPVDAEAAFLLTMPLLRPSAEVAGSIRLTAEIANDKQRDFAGVLATAREGQIVACTTELDGHADARISASPPAWLAAVIDRDPGGLQLGGDRSLVGAVLDELGNALFPSQSRPATSSPPSS